MDGSDVLIVLKIWQVQYFENFLNIMSDHKISRNAQATSYDSCDNRPFSLAHFVSQYRSCDNTQEVGPLFCSLKRVHASMNMSACTLFNEQNKGPNLLSIIT